MKVLLLRPEGSEVPQDPEIEIVNIPVLKPVCIPHTLPFMPKTIGFTSVNAVKCFNYAEVFEKVNEVYAVGPSTANALKDIFNVKQVIVPETFTVDSMVQKMLRNSKDKTILVRSSVGYKRDKEKYPHITQIVDYDLLINEENLRKTKQLLSDCTFNYVIITSSLIATLVKDSLRECTKVVSIGPSTTRALEGVNNIYEAREHDMNGIFILLKGFLRDD